MVQTSDKKCGHAHHTPYIHHCYYILHLLILYVMNMIVIRMIKWLDWLFQEQLFRLKLNAPNSDFIMGFTYKNGYSVKVFDKRLKQNSML